MSEFVRKTALGGYKTVQGGHSDPELTHVILTKMEYDGLISEIREAEKGTRAAVNKADQRIRAITNQANTEIRQAQADAEQSIREMQEKLTQEQAEKEYQQRLNANLLRISKERANASRKLKPKKEHSGYVVISSTEKDYSYKYGANRRTVRLWETVLQTPFSIDFTEEQARKETEGLFQEAEIGIGLIGRIGISGLYQDGYDRMIREKDAAGWMQRNTVVEHKIRANFRAGYWEIIFLHTKALGVVPAEMRP